MQNQDLTVVITAFSKLLNLLISYETQLEEDRQHLSDCQNFYPEVSFNFIKSFAEIQRNKMRLRKGMGPHAVPSGEGSDAIKIDSYKSGYISLDSLKEFLHYNLFEDIERKDLDHLAACYKFDRKTGIDFDNFVSMILPQSNSMLKVKILKKKIIYEANMVEQPFNNPTSSDPVVLNFLAKILYADSMLSKETEKIRIELLKNDWEPVIAFKKLDRDGKGHLNFKDLEYFMSNTRSRKIVMKEYMALLRRLKKYSQMDIITFEEFKELALPRSPYFDRQDVEIAETVCHKDFKQELVNPATNHAKYTVLRVTTPNKDPESLHNYSGLSNHENFISPIRHAFIDNNKQGIISSSIMVENQRKSQNSKNLIQEVNRESSHWRGANSFNDHSIMYYGGLNNHISKAVSMYSPKGSQSFYDKRSMIDDVASMYRPKNTNEKINIFPAEEYFSREAYGPSAQWNSGSPALQSTNYESRKENDVVPRTMLNHSKVLGEFHRQIDLGNRSGVRDSRNREIGQGGPCKVIEVVRPQMNFEPEKNLLSSKPETFSSPQRNSNHKIFGTKSASDRISPLTSLINSVPVQPIKQIEIKKPQQVSDVRMVESIIKGPTESIIKGPAESIKKGPTGIPEEKKSVIVVAGDGNAKQEGPLSKTAPVSSNNNIPGRATQSVNLGQAGNPPVNLPQNTQKTVTFKNNLSRSNIFNSGIKPRIDEREMLIVNSGQNTELAMRGSRVASTGPARSGGLFDKQLNRAVMEKNINGIEDFHFKKDPAMKMEPTPAKTTKGESNVDVTLVKPSSNPLY